MYLTSYSKIESGLLIAKASLKPSFTTLLEWLQSAARANAPPMRLVHAKCESVQIS